MRRFGAPVVVLVVLGVVVAIAFGADALWVYGFFAVLAAGTALAIGLGGDIISSWSRRRVEEAQRNPHERR
jgi:NhaP-type Na+/H+ or K+/H+ antiporter